MKLCPFSKKLKVKQRLFTFLHNSRSRQAQSNEIISSKMWIYELPRELPNELRPRILRNYKMSRKGPKCLKLMGKYSASHLKRQFWQFCYKTSKKKSAVTHSVQKPMLLYFMDFSTIFSPRLWNFPLFKRCTALTNVSNTINYHYQKGLRLWKAKECALNVCGKTFLLLITS